MVTPSIEITTKIGCPVNCKFCAQDKLVKRYSKYSSEYMMSLEIFKQCLDKIPKNVRIDFSGLCEPFANPKCIDMILYTSQQGYQMFLYSTLVGLNIEDIKKLRNIHFPTVCVHLADNEGNSNFVVDDNYISVLKDFVRNIQCGYHCHGSVHNMIRGIVGEAAEQVSITEDKLDSKAGSVSGKVYDYKYNRIMCNSSELEFNKNVLLPNGDVVLCCMDYKMEWVLGNLLRQNYDSLYNTKITNQLVFNCLNDCDDFICRKCTNSSNF